MRIVGYCGGGYRQWDPEEDKIIQSRDVVFAEDDVIFNKELFMTSEGNPHLVVSDIEDNITLVNTSDDEEEDFHGFDEEGNQTPKRPKRKITKPTKLNDYEIYTAYCSCAGEPADYAEAMKIGEAEFNAKDLGELKDFLGTNVTREGNQIKMSQYKLIDKMLVKFRMKDCNGANTPMENNFQVNSDEPVNENLPFRELVGSLMYVATVSRPNIAFAT
ncbi:hypothetical protein PR048_006462 [Dryococelus australis]|uniref:Polyprotein n=1 Tax=Dryococelus australis TaxID=614101 RepID=A0ABQ9IB34_9NEOP|nr:hypothetical protein PR048_006462 [Dryococelus australis]